MSIVERTAQRSELRASVAEFLSRAVPTDALKELCATQGFSADLWRRLADMDWFRLLLAEQHGGLGLGLADVGGLFEEVGRQPLPGPLLEHVVLAPSLVDSAPVVLHDRLEEVMRGARVLALADPCVDASVERRHGRVLVANGRVSGSVSHVRFGQFADDVVLLAEAEGGPLVVVVEAGNAQVEVSETAAIDPTTRYATVTFHDFVLDEGVVVATGEQAGAWADSLRSTLQLMVACELSGLSAKMLDMAVDYAKVRQQFGRPIGSFQAVKHILADMFVRSHSLEQLVAASLDDVDEDPSVLAMVAMVAKGKAAEISRSVGEDALQVHGGIGFTMEHDLHVLFKRALGFQGLYGDQRELALELGRRLVTEGQ